MSEYTKIGPGAAEQLKVVIDSLDKLPRHMHAAGLKPKEYSEIRTRVDALAHVVRRHFPEDD